MAKNKRSKCSSKDKKKSKKYRESHIPKKSMTTRSERRLQLQNQVHAPQQNLQSAKASESKTSKDVKLLTTPCVVRLQNMVFNELDSNVNDKKNLQPREREPVKRRSTNKSTKNGENTKGTCTYNIL